MSEIPLNKFEKERRVIDLHLEGKTIRDIAPIVHMSFRDISKKIKDYEKKLRLQQNKKGEDNRNGQIKKPSLSSQAFILYREGKKPIDVAIELNIPFEKVRKFWAQYLKLTRLYECYEFYQIFRYEIPTLLSIGTFIKRNSIHIKDISNVLGEAKTIANLRLRHSILKHDIEKLENSKNNYSLNQTTNYQPLLPLGLPKHYYNY